MEGGHYQQYAFGSAYLAARWSIQLTSTSVWKPSSSAVISSGGLRGEKGFLLDLGEAFYRPLPDITHSKSIGIWIRWIHHKLIDGGDPGCATDCRHYGFIRSHLRLFDQAPGKQRAQNAFMVEIRVQTQLSTGIECAPFWHRFRCRMGNGRSRRSRWKACSNPVRLWRRSPHSYGEPAGG